MTTGPILEGVPEGRGPLPGQVSDRARDLGHADIDFERLDRTGAVMALAEGRPTYLGASTRPCPHGTIQQVVYTRYRWAVKFDRWGGWVWRVYVAEPTLWAARAAEYVPAVWRPDFASAPLVAMPGQPGHHRRSAGKVRGTAPCRLWEELT
jgi:hypothetical protein